MEEGTKAAVSETVLEQQGEKQGEGGLLDKIRSCLLYTSDAADE